MADRNRTVVKLGGSLLHSSGWVDRFTSWLNRQPIGDYFIVVGGGQLIDALRDLDDRHRLCPSEMHWRCIRALDATYEIAAELLPDFGRIVSPKQLHAALGSRYDGNNRRAFWVRIASYYSQEIDSSSATEPMLELGWNTTSDSLALLLASQIRAERCVLLKSCEVSHVATLEQAAVEGIVDSESIRFQSIVPAIEFDQI